MKILGLHTQFHTQFPGGFQSPAILKTFKAKISQHTFAIFAKRQMGIFKWIL